MKFRKHLGIWLLFTLVMAIGIGTVAAITLYRNGDGGNTDRDSGSVTEEQTDALSGDSTGTAGSYLSNQRKHDIDMGYLGEIAGEYQAASADLQSSGIDEDYWRLSIASDYRGKGPYLSLYDNAEGKTGFEGRIMYLKDKLVIVEIDNGSYEKMPSGWKAESEGKYAILDCVSMNGGVRLGYRGSEILFLTDSQNH